MYSCHQHQEKCLPIKPGKQGADKGMTLARFFKPTQTPRARDIDWGMTFKIPLDPTQTPDE